MALAKSGVASIPFVLQVVVVHTLASVHAHARVSHTARSTVSFQGRAEALSIVIASGDGAVMVQYSGSSGGMPQGLEVFCRLLKAVNIALALVALR